MCACVIRTGLPMPLQSRHVTFHALTCHIEPRGSCLGPLIQTCMYAYGCTLLLRLRGCNSPQELQQSNAELESTMHAALEKSGVPGRKAKESDELAQVCACRVRSVRCTVRVLCGFRYSVWYGSTAVQVCVCLPCIECERYPAGVVCGRIQVAAMRGPT